VKVSIPITIEFDPSDWRLTFGDMSDAELRESVTSYVLSQIEYGGVFSDGEVPLKSIRVVR